MFLDTAGSASDPAHISAAMPNALEAPAAWEASQMSRKDWKVRSSEIRRHFRLEARVKRDESLKGILLSPSTVSCGDESLDGTSICLEHLKQ